MSDEQNPEQTPDTPEEAVEAPEAAEPINEVEALNAELEQWKARAYRATADLDNGRRRMQKEMEDARRFAVNSLLRDLLPVADNLERAVAASTDGAGIIDGVKMVLNQMSAALDKHGARPFDPEGKPFDPQFHQAMAQVEREDVAPGTVVQVYQRGWMLHDRLAREAMVVVSKAPAEAPEAVEAEEEA